MNDPKPDVKFAIVRAASMAYPGPMNHPTYRLLFAIVEALRDQLDPDVYSDLSGLLTQIKLAMQREPGDDYLYTVADAVLAMSSHITGVASSRSGSTPNKAQLTAALQALSELPPRPAPPPPSMKRLRGKLVTHDGAEISVEVGATDAAVAVGLSHVVAATDTVASVEWDGWTNDLDCQEQT